jgi:hypothetical protein
MKIEHLATMEATSANVWTRQGPKLYTPHQFPAQDTMLEKLISDASISDSETKHVTIRILVTRVNDTRHWLVIAHALGTIHVTNNDISVTLAKKTCHL